MKSFETHESATSHRDSGDPSPRTAASTNGLRTTVLLSLDGRLDGRTSSAMCSRVRDLLDLGIGVIFLDLSGVGSVDAPGLFHLIQVLDYADAHGGGVAILEGSDELTAYFRDI